MESGGAALVTLLVKPDRGFSPVLVKIRHPQLTSGGASLPSRGKNLKMAAIPVHREGPLDKVRPISGNFP